MITIPGLIDTHTHLREPGATQKEDFESGTKAALAGGYTTILDMPNNPQPTVTPEALGEKIKLAKNRIYADLGFHFGATADSVQYFPEVQDRVFGLKVYMNHTTGTLLQEAPKVLQTIFASWPKDKILMVHAEGETLKIAIDLASKFNNKLHVCHVSEASEISLIKQAKGQGLSITCEVTAHHLFLSHQDAKKLGPYGMMRPPLADPDILWKGIKDDIIDTIASDHAPHTKEEKLSVNPPNGVPGLETTLPLLLTAVNEGKLTIERLIELTNKNPKRIFSIPDQKDTFVEIDPTVTYNLSPVTLFTKCHWTPFEGKSVKGKVKRVVLRGQTVFENDQILGKPQGIILKPIWSGKR